MITDLLPWKKHKKDEIEVNKNNQDSDNSPFSLLHDRINHLFDDFFSDHFAINYPETDKTWQLQGLNPSFDVTETDDKLEISAELPGLDKDDVDVSIDNNLLCIKGEKKEEKEEKKKDYHLSERRYGSFCRYFPLHEGLNLDHLKADFKKGVLKISMPKTEEAKKSRKKIPVN